MTTENDKTDDSEVWQRVARGITPLKRRAKRIVPAVETPSLEPKFPKPGKPGVKAKVSPPPAPPVRPPHPAETAETAIAGLDKRAVRQLRRGTVAIHARLDLHGMTQDAAHIRLGAFLARSQDAGHRLVLVITGKGLKLDGRVGVLREAVPRWLNEAPNRARILGFTHAAQKDGGTGALYIRLRRKP